MNNLKLGFPAFPLGTHQTPWDMSELMYQGAAEIPRHRVQEAIMSGSLGKPIKARMAMLIALHESITAFIAQGRSRSAIVTYFELTWRFYAWADKQGHTIQPDTVVDIYKEWTEFLIDRSVIHKQISEIFAYRQAVTMANIIAKAIQLPGSKPGRSLVLRTRIRKPLDKKKVLSKEADKQNLEKTFEFGITLTAITDALDVKTVRGSLPIYINLANEKVITLLGSIMSPDLDPETIKDATLRRRAEDARKPLQDHESLFDRHKRSGIINLRIEAELLIFLAQTGMNLRQAADMERDSYRWKSDGGELEVFRVYKGRRSGDAIFRCYKAYKNHFQRYLTWLDKTGLSEIDSRLFPQQSRSMITVKGQKVRFYTTKTLFDKVGIPFINPQEIRKTRVNWLLRRSHNLELTADQMAHDKEVLLRDYERPHHQSASAEIIQFHKATDPVIAPPGPGICVDDSHSSTPISGIAHEAPKPDCISPEGCLFCTKHRDVMSADYCWKLASHARIKRLETDLYKSPQKGAENPAYRVIERITAKLEAISAGSAVRATWVQDAKDAVRSGRYHPHWDGHIKLLEVIA